MSVEAPPITNEGMHDPPGGTSRKPPSRRQIELLGNLLRDSFIGYVAIAFAGVDILGVKPFEFLRGWGEDRIEEAQENYLLATNAQSSANYANSLLISLTNAGLASDVSGGVAITEPFNGPSASNLGANFTRFPNGSGGGSFGPNGSGHVRWSKSGGLTRSFNDLHVTPLATDYQAVLILLSTKPEGPSNGGIPANSVYARVGATFADCVYARWYYNEVEIGFIVGGSNTVLDSISLSWNAGDVWWFLVGTDDDEREFVLKRNGNEVLRATDTADASQMGSGHLGVGMGAYAVNRDFFTTQSAPGGVDVWSAADRQPTTLNV